MSELLPSKQKLIMFIEDTIEGIEVLERGGSVGWHLHLKVGRELLAELRARAPETSAPLASQFHDMLHRDQTGLSAGLERVLTTVGGFRWATESRGCYEWDDDRFHGEMKNMLDAIQKAAQDALDAWKRGPLPCCVLERSAVKAAESLQEPTWICGNCQTVNGDNRVLCRMPSCRQSRPAVKTTERLGPACGHPNPNEEGVCPQCREWRERGPVKRSVVPTCNTHGVELAFEGDECWECKKERQL